MVTMEPNKTNPVPFISREAFEAAKCKPDALFPIMDYDFCKRVWETSPLIAHLCAELSNDSENKDHD